MKLRIPTKLGNQNLKHIMSTFVTDAHPGAYCEGQGYKWRPAPGFLQRDAARGPMFVLARSRVPASC